MGLGTGYLATVLSMVVGLWLTPFTLKFLTREEFGVFTLASDVIAWFALADLGIAASLRVQAARLSGMSDQKRMSELASTAFFAELGLGLFVLGVGIVSASLFPYLFNVPPALSWEARGMVAVLALSMAIHIGLLTFSALLVAHQQIHIDNLLRILLVTLRTALIVGLLLAGWRLYSLAFANLLAEITTTGIAYIRCRHSLSHVLIRPYLASWKELKGVVKTGLWFTVGGLAGILIEGMDRVVAAKVVSLESVTSLALTGRLYLLAYGLIGQVTNTARPALGELLGKGDLQAARRAYDHIALGSTAIAMAVGLGIWAGNEAFVRWWVGSENYGGAWLDTAFAANLLVNCWILPNRATLAAALIIRRHALSRIIEGVANLVMSVWLGLWLGLPGVIAGTALACLTTSYWYLPRLTAQLFHQGSVRFFWVHLQPHIICGALGIAAAATVKILLGPRYGIFLAAASIGGVAMVSMLAFLFLGIDQKERNYIKDIVLAFRP